MGLVSLIDEPTQAEIDPQMAEQCLHNVEALQLPDWELIIARNGQIGVHCIYHHAQQPNTATLWPVYSLSKPITAALAMILIDRGVIELDSHVQDHLKQFSHPQVYVRGAVDSMMTRPAIRPILVRHLLTHTAGFVYGQDQYNPVDEVLRNHGCEVDVPLDWSLEELMNFYSRCPLLFDPGAHFNYSVASDVLGALIEQATGQDLQSALSEYITEPLGMKDTYFRVPENQRRRVTPLYSNHDGRIDQAPALDLAVQQRQALLGGVGITTTAHDYYVFLTSLLASLNKSHGALLSPESTRFMISNQLPSNDIFSSAFTGKNNSQDRGMGYGAGVGIIVGREGRQGCRLGEITWGGYTGSTFSLDPYSGTIVVFTTNVANPPNTWTPVHQHFAAELTATTKSDRSLPLIPSPQNPLGPCGPERPWRPVAPQGKRGNSR